MERLREWKFGTHQAYFEAPDFLCFKFEGATKPEHAQSTIDICREVGEGGPYFIVLDVSKSSIDKAGRDVLTQQMRPEWFKCLYYVGAGPVQRAMIKALLLVLLFSEKWKNIEVEFVDSEKRAGELIALRSVRKAG